MQKYSVVIPVLGNLSYTKTCLESLNRHSTMINDVIIIENEKRQSTKKWLDKHRYSFKFPISILTGGEKFGVAASWNMGIKYSGERFVAVVNNDIEVIEHEWDRILFEQWNEYPEAAIFCPWPIGSKDERHSKNGNPYPGLNGSFFVLDKDKVEKTDNFVKYGNYIDTGYKIAYWEDADLLVQVRRAGYESYVEPKVPVVHYSNKTAGKLLPSGKNMDNPYWINLDYFNKKYSVLIWDYFKVHLSNILHEESNEPLI